MNNTYQTPSTTNSICYRFSNEWLHSFAYLFVYSIYIAINLFTTTKLFFQRNNYTEAHFVETILIWNVVHVLSMIPDLWASTDTARIFRTICSMVSSLLQSTFWWYIFPELTGGKGKLYAVEYLLCCILLLCEVLYRLTRQHQKNNNNQQQTKFQRFRVAPISVPVITDTAIVSGNIVNKSITPPPAPRHAELIEKKKQNVNVLVNM